MKKYLILFIILAIAVSFVEINATANNIYGVKDCNGNLIAITDTDCLTPEQEEQGYTIEILFEKSISLNKPAAKQEKSPELIQAEKEIKARIEELENKSKDEFQADIVFVDSTNFVQGNYYYLQGILKNKGKMAAYWVKVKILALDKNDNLIQLKETYANPNTIAPGHEATYDTMIKYDSKISKFSKEVYWSTN